jgi:hypothetical protein
MIIVLNLAIWAAAYLLGGPLALLAVIIVGCVLGLATNHP